MPSSARKHKPLLPPGQRVAKRNARKKRLIKYSFAPRPKAHPRRGNPRSSLYRTPPRPSGSHRRPAGTISRRPPSARRATAPERVQAAFSFGPCTARFLFRKLEKKMGGASRLDKPPAGAESPWPPDGGPNFHGRFVTSLTRSRGGHTIGPPRAVAPTGARNGFTPARRCAPADNPW